jgi:glutathione synthase/RimK-type ligase-like ATP-grasp enzyme
MKFNKTLFITSIDDAHADYIINLLNERGLNEWVVRLNTEHFIDNCKVSFNETEFEISIKDSKRVINSSEISSVWYRRPKSFLYQTDDLRISNFIHKQAKSLLRGMYFATHDTSKWINPLPNLHRARIKLQQLQLANSIGFNVPKTLATNDKESVLDFISKVKFVSTKSLDEPNFQTDKFIYPIFNRKIKPEYIIKHIDSIEKCPTLFQEYIQKNADIRVVVIGEKIFAFKIYSQDNPLSIEDFRGIAPSFLKHELIQLPSIIEEKIFAYTQKQGLIYSAFDFVLSKDNEFYFIENNPNGQWLWLELQTGVKISDALIDELTLIS